MNGNSLIADTNIVLLLLGGDKTVTELLHERYISLSFITELELLSYKGISQKEMKIVENFISECNIIDITPQIKQTTIKLRKKYNLKLPDAIIGATCKVNNLPLITADRDFHLIKEFQVILYEA